MRGARTASWIVAVVHAIAWLAIVPGVLWAQPSTGRIFGTVSDSSGGVLPGVSIVATNDRTKIARTTASLDNGHFEITELPVGRYTVTFELMGFKTVVTPGVVVSVSEATRVATSMEVGNIEERVEVAGAAAFVETREPTLGAVVEERRIAEMPLNGRNFLQLSSFAPGVTVNYRPIALKGSPSSMPGGLANMPSVNGTRNTMNAVLIDGASNNDPVLNTAAIVPVPDAIEEFKIQTNMYPASFGQGGGSVINIVTKSGGVDFHGSAYYFGRNDALDAENFFLAQKPDLRRHQAGGTAGGPLRAVGLGSRTFFFGTFESLRLERGGILNSIVPTPAQRRGDFTSSPNRLRDPVGGCIAGNVINPACMDPVAVNLIDRLWPSPNAGANLYQDAPNLTNDRDQFLIKIDQSTEKHTVSGRYVIDDGVERTPVAGLSGVGAASGSGVPGFPVTNPSRFQNFVASDTWILSNRALNQLRFAYIRTTFGNNLLQERDDPAAFGLRYPVNEFPSLPGFSVAGFALTGPPAQKDFSKKNQIFVIADSFTYELGSHSLNVGGEIRRSMVDVDAGNFTAGNFSFSGIVTGNSFADFLLGAPESFLQVSGDARRNFRSLSYAAFFEDNYKVRSNVTLTLGVRYEVFGPFGDPSIHDIGHPRLATFIAGKRSTWAPDLPVGIVLAGFDEGVRETIVATDYNNFAPRLGVAWDPRGDGKFSIRAGYGIFYDATVLDGVINSTDGTPSIRPAASAFLPGTRALSDPFRGRSPFNPPITFPIPTTTGLSPTIVDPDQRTAYVQQWNATVQSELPGNMLLQVGYVGTRARNLTGPVNFAQACFASVERPCNGETTNTAANLTRRRPYPGLNGLTTVVGAFSSDYHGLQTGLTRRMAGGLAFQLSYTLSQTMDDSSKVNSFFNIEGQTNPQDNYNIAAERARSAFDARHRLVANFSYELPFARGSQGFVKHLAGDWQVNGIVSLQSGSPFTVFDSRGRSLAGGGADRPDQICDPNLPASQPTPDRWFDTACFQEVPLGVRFGTAGRNTVLADSVETFDLSLMKSLRPSSGTRVEFRLEIFNVLNHRVFAVPVNNLASPLFGRVLATAVDERQMQFALKFIF
ncbi:MAG: TonB-dependent receptor [Acidobacteria bacterium]|nr:TonB-dependent receptor [Acidobacteriota bacterium]